MNTTTKSSNHITTALRGYVALAAALVVMVIFFSFASRHFFSAKTFTTIANEIPDLVVMSVGMTFILIVGAIDLSVGSVLALAGSAVSVAILHLGLNPWAAAALGLAAAGACGLFTGLVTVAWKIPSFIVSLAVLEIARGLAYRLTNSRTEYIGDAYEWLSSPVWGGISPAFIFCLACVIVAQLVLVKTVFGRYVIAIGTNEEAVRLVGIDPRVYKVICFVLVALLSGVGALFQISRLEAADPNAGIGIELQVIAAVVIGGTSLMGGRGSVISTFFGVLIIAVLESGLTQIGASDPTKRIITGAVIVLAVILDTYRSRRSRARH